MYQRWRRLHRKDGAGMVKISRAHYRTRLPLLVCRYSFAITLYCGPMQIFSLSYGPKSIFSLSYMFPASFFPFLGTCGKIFPLTCTTPHKIFPLHGRFRAHFFPYFRVLVCCYSFAVTRLPFAVCCLVCRLPFALISEDV